MNDNIAEIQGDGGSDRRLTKVETKVDNITVELTGMWKSLRDIQDSINRANKTDWMTLATIGGLILTLIGCLYAAAIHPITADVERAAQSANKLAEAVLVQNEKFNTTETKVVLQNAQIDSIQEMLKNLNAHGTVDSDKRLSLLEARLEWERKNQPAK